MKCLMVDPYNYDVTYSINPWMNTSMKVNRSIAISQWHNLQSILEGIGIEVNVAESTQGLPDMVFAANAGKVYKKKVLLGNFRDKERKGESPHFKKWFDNNGYVISELDPTYVWEGEACSIETKGTLIYSYGYRSDKLSYLYVREFYKHTDLKFVELIDPYFYHLDVSLAILENEILLYCPLAFKVHDQYWLANKFPNSIEVSFDDALNLGCNVFSYRKNLVINSNVSDQLIEQIESFGFKVYRCDVSEFIKAGGGVKCLILTL